MSVHVPAWKRLGLRLKNDNVVNEAKEAGIRPPSKKRKLSNDASPIPSIKHVVTIKESEHGEGRSNGSAGSRSHNNASSNGDTVQKKISSMAVAAENGNTAPSRPVTQAKDLKKRKFVSFTPDAKEADGPAEPDEPPRSDDGEVVMADSETVKTTKKIRKARPAGQVQQGPQSAHKAQEIEIKTQPKPYLQYLQQFASNKTEWKFNKNRQVQLLQNLFNLYRIPVSYNSALAEYIATLQGESARARLREEAQQIISNSVPPVAEAQSDLTEDGSESVSNAVNGSTKGVEEERMARAKVIVGVLGEGAKGVVIRTTVASVVTKGDPSQTPTSLNDEEKSKRAKRSRGAARKQAPVLHSLEESDSGEGT